MDAALCHGIVTPDEIQAVCHPHVDGSPRKSSYLSIYRVLERVPLAALKTLWLATDEGKVIGLERGPYECDGENRIHLYQEFCPVTPRVLSLLSPGDFTRQITDTRRAVSVPKIVFADLHLGGMATDPYAQDVENLPYPNIHHMRDCALELKNSFSKKTKTVIRQMTKDTLYRTIKSGFFVGGEGQFVHYPMPSRDDLETKYYTWWRSALMTFGQ
ncbi:hypothetical protein QQ056_06840 [Oscillatoria laete-virens NRMC-F 0139]|nr:hypothetical protein [Oscillatoria laete-virens]MDL5053259.1 hypothetical protein [Oscillatoria laete-virens NRMC-F 0139]